MNRQQSIFIVKIRLKNILWIILEQKAHFLTDKQ